MPHGSPQDRRDAMHRSSYLPSINRQERICGSALHFVGRDHRSRQFSSRDASSARGRRLPGTGNHRGSVGAHATSGRATRRGHEARIARGTLWVRDRHPDAEEQELDVQSSDRLGPGIDRDRQTARSLRRARPRAQGGSRGRASRSLCATRATPRLARAAWLRVRTPGGEALAQRFATSEEDKWARDQRARGPARGRRYLGRCRCPGMAGCSDHGERGSRTAPERRDGGTISPGSMANPLPQGRCSWAPWGNAP